MSSTFGTNFRVTTFGESHSHAVGAILDGCPPRLELSEKDIQPQLDRRRPGQSSITTPRTETDTVTIMTGVENGLTLGTPICMIVPNRDQKPEDYSEMSDIPRPSHADFTYLQKYGIKASSGGGRSSARETIGRVAAGAIAEKLILKLAGIEIVAWVSAIGPITAEKINPNSVSREDVDKTMVRCPDLAASKKMIDLVTQVKDEEDSIGGIVTCVCRSVPAGLGDPVFDKLEARLAHAMLSLPATKGFEIGSGFSGSAMRGRDHNDSFILKEDRLGTVTNFSGGIQGGISNGEPIQFRVAFKPPATIGIDQQTVNFKGEPVTLKAKGRHDPCVVPRAVPIIETTTALVIADCLLNQRLVR